MFLRQLAVKIEIEKILGRSYQISIVDWYPKRTLSEPLSTYFPQHSFKHRISIKRNLQL